MKRTSARILDIRSVTPSALEIVIERTDQRPFFSYRPGQYATLSFPDVPSLRGERSFSIASAPTDRSTLRFGIRILGKYTTALTTLRPGEAVMVSGPYGGFIFDPRRDRTAVFLAGGIGITPFLSMIRTATDERWPNNLVLLYSVRSMEDIPFAAELDALEQKNANLKIVYAITDGQVPPRSQRIIPGRINQELIAWAANNDPVRPSYFLCGPPTFMAAMAKTLEAMGLDARDMKTERFSVGSSAFIERGTVVPRLAFAAWGVAAAIVLGVVVRAEQSRRATALSDVVAPAVINEAPTQNRNSGTAVPKANVNTNSTGTGNSNVATAPTQPSATTNPAPTKPAATSPKPAVTTPKKTVPAQPAAPSRTVPRTMMS